MGKQEQQTNTSRLRVLNRYQVLFFFSEILNMLFVQVRKALQRKKEIWSSRRTFFTPSSSIPSSAAAAATASHGATLSVIMFDI